MSRVDRLICHVMPRAFLMALGGCIAMSDRLYRLTVKQKITAPAGASPAA